MRCREKSSFVGVIFMFEAEFFNRAFDAALVDKAKELEGDHD